MAGAADRGRPAEARLVRVRVRGRVRGRVRLRLRLRLRLRIRVRVRVRPRHASGVSHSQTRVTLALVSSTGAPAQCPGRQGVSENN